MDKEIRILNDKNTLRIMRMPTTEKITRPLNNYRGICADISLYAYCEILL